MKFDDITILLGEFGKYQKILYLLVCLPAIFTGMQMLSPVFILSIPDHRCQIPGWSNDTFEVMNDEHRAAINRSIPWEKDDDDDVYSSCNIYRTDVNTTFSAGNVPINTSTMECDSWVYDESVFESTFITKTDLICGSEIARANANMIMFGGVLVGAIVIGIFSDIFGRKPAVILSAFIHIASAFGSAFAPNYAVFVTMRFFIGVSNMGLFMSMFVIGMELVGPSKRVAAGIIIEFFWCLGLFLLLLLAYFIRTWDKLLLSFACPSVLLLLYFWLIPESPRWLILQGKLDKADKVIQKCAKVNKVKLPDDYLAADSADEGPKSSVLKLLTSPRLLFRTLIIYFNWLVVSMVYYGLGLNVGNLNGDIYVNFAINSAMEIAAYAACLFLLNKTGRKVLHAGTMILGGLACLSTIFTVLYADESLDWITMILSNVGKFGISAAFAIIYVWSAELFPTMVRNSGMGTSSMCARIGGMVSPYIADLGELVDGPFGKALPLIIFGGLSVLAGLLSLLLPETNGKILPETIEDAENFGSDDGQTPKNDKSSKYYLNNAFDNIGESTEGYKQKL